MFIERAMPQDPRGPLRLLGQIDELRNTAELFGYKSPTCWRILALAQVDVYQGKVPNVILTRGEFSRLADRAITEFVEGSPIDAPAHTPQAEHTGFLAVAEPDIRVRSRVIATILDYCSETRGLALQA